MDLILLKCSIIRKNTLTAFKNTTFATGFIWEYILKWKVKICTVTTNYGLFLNLLYTHLTCVLFLTIRYIELLSLFEPNIILILYSSVLET